MKRIPRPRDFQVLEQVQDVDPRRGIEHADDLVGDEEPDVEQECAGAMSRRWSWPAQLVLAGDRARVEAHGVQRLSDIPCHSESVSPEKYPSGAS